MKMMRAARFLFPVVALFGLVTCGGSSSTGSGTGGVGAGGKADNTGGKTSAGGTTGSGGISGGVGGTTGGGPRQCGSSGGTNTCTKAETDQYSMCVVNACDAQYKSCLGPDYKNGNYSGVCATSFQCQDKCACGDTSCIIGCLPSTECTTCLAGLATCSATCTEPACYKTGNGGISGGLGGISGGLGGILGSLGGIFGGLGGASGGATCADLLACCDRASATYKPTCMAAYTSSMANGDLACSLSLSGIKALFCP